MHDIPHGGGLAILFPNWMKHVLHENVDRFKQFAIRVFHVQTEGKTDVDIALEGIEALRQFWTSIGAPDRLADYKIGEEQIDVMAEKAMAYGEFGQFKKLNKQDVVAIYQASL